MSRKPHLVHLTTTDISLDWLLSPQLRAFQEDGYEVTTVSAPGSHVEAIESAGIRHIPLRSLTRRMDPLADLRAARDLKELLDRLRPQILHTHNPKPGVLGRLLGHNRGVPVVVNTVHGLYAQPTDSRRRRAAVYAAEALALRFSDMELVQNIEDMFTLRQLGAPRDKLLHLGNGIDLDRFRKSTATRARGMSLRRSLGIKADGVVVGMVARMVWEKGYRELFAAIEDLARAGYDGIEFVIAGPTEPHKSGAVDAETIARMKAKGVHILGERRDVENIYAAMDICVLPSHREGVPRTAMEASAMGVPMVASDIRGNRQVVADGMTGHLVPMGESRALARAIAQLVVAGPTRRAMGEAGVRRARQRFDQNRVIDLTLGVYRSQLRAAGLVGAHSEPVINLRYVDSISLVETAASKSDAASRAA